MRRKTSCCGLAGKIRGTLFLAILMYVIFTFLVFGGGKASAVTWQAQGPSPILYGDAVIAPTTPLIENPVVGAVQSLLIDPNDNSIMYAGAVNGGIWKTTDGGGTWTPLTDNLKSLSVDQQFTKLLVRAG